MYDTSGKRAVFFYFPFFWNVKSFLSFRIGFCFIILSLVLLWQCVCSLFIVHCLKLLTKMSTNHDRMVWEDYGSIILWLLLLLLFSVFVVLFRNEYGKSFNNSRCHDTVNEIVKTLTLKLCWINSQTLARSNDNT